MTFEEFAEEQRKNLFNFSAPIDKNVDLATAIASIATETTLRILRNYHSEFGNAYLPDLKESEP